MHEIKHWAIVNLLKYQMIVLENHAERCVANQELIPINHIGHIMRGVCLWRKGLASEIGNRIQTRVDPTNDFWSLNVVTALHHGQE